MRLRLLIPLTLMSAVALCGSMTVFSQAKGSITGVVKDPAGAVISGARIAAKNEATGETINATADDLGRFKIAPLSPGRYTLTIESTGFKKTERSVVVEGERAAAVEVRLEVAAPTAEINVRTRGKVVPNTEPRYRQTRDQEIAESYTVNNLALKRDVGVFTLTSGTVSFVAPTMDRVVKAVFVGQGEFTLVPAVPVERDHLRQIIEKDSVHETFEKAAFVFTDETYQEIKSKSQPTAREPRASDVLHEFQKRVRYRPERPRSLVEYLLAYEGENLDAEILADLYNPNRKGFFIANIFGSNYNDLRFFCRPRGAIPQLLSPEEVALVDLDANGERDGVWYMAHLESEYKNRTASSEEDKRVIDVQNYRIETVIEGSGKLTATAEISFVPTGDGDRVLNFGLLPTLRVSRTSLGDQEINFIQEARKDDGSFYVVLPEPMAKGKQYKITIEYRGDKVVEDAGGGNFAVGARTSWYPSANAFNDRATFDLTFKVPKQYTLVGVGKLAKEWHEGDYAASQWVSEVPLAVAGFNFGSFKKKSINDATTKYDIEGYATSELPAYMRSAPPMGTEDPSQIAAGITPSRLTDRGIAEAENSIRIFTKYFGEAPYGRIAITQQPQPNFGQSWPTLVYLPLVSFLDATQRYMILRGINSRLTEFIDEVTPHEVSHQWWGHIVGWSSYHDQWLSEGFADFSAGLYLQLTEPKPDKYLRYWQHHRETILEKNNWGRRANDSGPLWMGLRLSTFKSPGAYQRIVYPKGGYILHMLRSIMWNNKTGDQQFIEMMQDFVKTNFNQNASTEGFKKVVERHMIPLMDVDGNKRMDWFFNEWVYGTEVPSYKFQYSLVPDADGKTVLKGVVTQSGVSQNFKMIVPIYLDFDGKIMRLGEVTLVGNSSTNEFQVKLPQKPKRALINAYHDILAVDEISEQK
jgi:carboxypeptidase family protein/peptidase M1-like protein